MSEKLLLGVGIVGLLGVLFWPSGSSQRVKAAFEEAEQFLAAQKYEEAIGHYQAALVESQKPFVKTEVIDPDFHTLANYKIAFCYTQIADQTGDISRYDDAVEIIEPLYAKAEVRRHRELITFLWGYVLFKQQKYEEADPKFREVIDNFPTSRYLENAWYSIGQLNFELQEFDRARAAYKQIVTGFPNSTFRDDAQHLIAQSFLLEQNYEQAFREFDNLTPEAFQNSPLLGEASYKASYCLLQLDRLEEAIDRYSRFVTAYRDSYLVTAAYFDLGTIYTRQKDYDSAIQNYQLAIENTDDMDLKSEIQYEIGDNYLEGGDFASAVTAYQTVIDVYPDSPYIADARFSVGEAYMALAGANSLADYIDEENYRNGVAAYQIVLNEHPGSEYEPHATFQIAESYYQIGDFEMALSWYENVMDRYPDDPLTGYALYGALWSLSELGRNEELLARGRAFIYAHIDDPDFDLQAAEIQMKLGDIMFEQDEFILAAQEYVKAVDFPELPKFYAVKLRSFYQQGVSFYRAGEASGDDSDFAQAIAPLTRAIEDFADEVFNLNYEFPERIPLRENSILNLANVHEQLEQWDATRAAYALIEPDSENYGRAVVLIAEAYEKEKAIDQAIEHYQAIANDDTLSETWQSLGAIRLADLLRGEARWLEASAAYASIVERYPTSEYVDAARYLIGVCHYSIEPRTAENVRQSIAAFQVVLDESPDSDNAPDALYGIVLATKVLAEEGEADWHAVVALADSLREQYGSRTQSRAQKAVNSGALLKVFAIEQIGEGGIDSMIASLREVAASDAADESARVTAQLKIGNLLFEDGRFEEAVPEYRKLAEDFPQSERAALGYYQAAVSAYKHGDALAQEDENFGTPWFRQTVELGGKALDLATDDALILSISYTSGLAQTKVGQMMSAIESLRRAASFEGVILDADKAPVIEAAHVELARIHQTLAQYEDAAAEYEHIASTSADANLRTRAHLSVADIYETNLDDQKKAVDHYLQAADISPDPILAANALYRGGIILEQFAAATDDPDDANAALAAFERLQDEHAASPVENVQLMVADAGVRASDLYEKLGNVEGALEKAEVALERALRTSDVVQRVQAQYQVANLRARLANTLFDETEGSANMPYKTAAREAVQNYLTAVELAGQLAEAPDSARLFSGAAMYQAGIISYSIHGPVDLPIVADVFAKFVSQRDQGFIQATDEDIRTALYYTGVTLYDLARSQDEEARSQGLDAAMFDDSAGVLQRLVDRFPGNPESGLWQYQVGEAFFASRSYERALEAYLSAADDYPKHPSAAESLYSAAACYGYLGNTEAVFETYERIATGYATSQYAAEAFLSVGDSRYNDAIDVEGDAQIGLLREAMGNYARVIDLPNASAESKSTAEGYIEETAELLASLEYGPMEERFNEAISASEADHRTAVLASIAEFEQLITEYPTATSSQIALTKIADAYVAIEQWQDALDTFNRLLSMYVEEKTGRPLTPGDEYVGRALNYARTQYVAISRYLDELSSQDGSGSASAR